MKFFLQSISFIWLLLSAQICAAEVILDLDDTETIEKETPTFPEVVDGYISIGKYFNETYPGNEIEKDFSEDVAQKFPNLSQQEVYDREATIRWLIKFYRYGKEVYEDIKAKFLLPEEPPLIVAETEYDLPKKQEYIPSDDLVVVEDFKKVLSYGGNVRDFKAYKARYEREKQASSQNEGFAKLNTMLKKLEWKKLLFYGVIYEDPFVGKQGTGKWVKSDNVEIRLIAEDSTINNKKDIRGGIHFDLKADYFILAQNYKEYKKPTISFADSKNLVKATYDFPVPLRLSSTDGQTAAVWKGNFMLPLKLAIKDINQPLELKAKAEFTICSREFICKEEQVNLELKLEAGEGFYSSVNNFIIQSFYRQPQEKTSVFELKKAVVDEVSPTEEVLRLEFSTKDDLNNFDVYVEDEDNILFERPRISVGDNGITARLSPVNKTQKLENHNFTITARLNDEEYLRKSINVQKASGFDYQIGHLSLSLILMAVIGGFLLNFMPCVFPVLSIKLLSLTKFGATSPEKLRRNFALTIGGIFASFELIAIMLSLLKFGGKSIGWGMQFQNPIFLIIMIFAITIFMAIVWNWLGIKTPQWLKQQLTPKKKTADIAHFFTGALAVLMSTPCTAPYLGTAIGFALGGSIMDIWLVLNAVALGLSLPYILVYYFPNIVDFMPKPGSWMERLNKIMGFMLFLTLVWLLSILYAQMGWSATFRTILYIGAFLFILYYRHQLLDAVDETDFEPEVKERVFCWYNRSIISVLIVILSIALFDGVRSFNTEQEISTSGKEEIINYDKISARIKEGKTVIVAVGADWCLTCKYNDATVFDNAIIENFLKNNNVELIEVDWTSYNKEVLSFMKKFGRQGLPFYVAFSPMVPDGMVLPEILTERNLSKILRSISE